MKNFFDNIEMCCNLPLRHDLYVSFTQISKDKPGKVDTLHFNRSCRNYLASAFLFTTKSCDQ